MLATAVFAGAVIVQPAMGEAFTRASSMLATLGALFHASLATAPVVSARSGGLPDLVRLLVNDLSVAARILVSLDSTIVPFGATFIEFASPTNSEAFFVIGTLIVIRVIIG